MKKLLTILTIVICSTASAQLCFIDQPASQVKSFWQKKLSPKFITTDVHKGTTVPESVWIMADTSVGAPIFYANFNTAGKCTRHQSMFKAEALEQYISLLNSNKSLTRKNDRWYNNAKKCYYKIEEDKEPQMFQLVCMKN